MVAVGFGATQAARIARLIHSAATSRADVDAAPPCAPAEPNPQWRVARYAAISAHCAQHLGDGFAYVTYTLATFGIATLQELSDHQLEQTYAHFGLATMASPVPAPICPHACPGVGDGESKRAHISAFPARFARFLMNAAKSVIPQSRQALSSFFALACSVSKRAHPHTCA